MEPMPNRARTKEAILGMLRELKEDWEYSGEVTEETGIFRDLEFESIDAVALGCAIEEHFAQPLPFAEFLTQAKEDALEDINIGLLIDFILKNLDGSEGRQTG